jgi:undecaprenyl phosphate N,N'-diacetylbacillosamine 1-phosphate transferase
MYRNYLKPLIDFIFALIVSILLLIPFLIVAILIKIDSKGPIFFYQPRLGKNKKVFNIIKFRTMTDGERIIQGQVFKDNAEITRVGYYLRRFKIDEMTQIFNMLQGDMSIVGPRPCLPSILEKYNLNDQYRFEVKPGLSSLAGVNGSIFLTWDEKWQYDEYYVTHLSFLLDLKIILKTFLVIVRGEEKFLKKPNSQNNGN